MQISNAELQRIFCEMRSKQSDRQQKATEELKNLFRNFQEYSEEIFLNVQKLIDSNELHEKLGGLYALEKLQTVIPENMLFSFINKFLSVTFQQFQINNEIQIYKKTAEVFGKLLKQGGTKIAQVVESNVDIALTWLKQENNKENKKLAGILALKKLLVEVPYITFSRIFVQGGGLQNIINIIRDKRYEIRKEALDFWEECIKQICQRDRRQQQELIQELYKEVENSLAVTEVEIIHGNICIIKSLLTHSREGILDNQLENITQIVLHNRHSRNQYVQLAVIECLPTLAKVGKQMFVNKFLSTSINFLLTQALQAKVASERSLAYSTLAQIFDFLDPTVLTPHLKAILNQIQKEQELRKPGYQETLTCLNAITTKFQLQILLYIDIQSLIDSVLLGSLSNNTIQFLNQLCSLHKQDLSQVIQCKLLITISALLTGKVQLFGHLAPEDQNLINKFQQKLLQVVQVQQEYRTTETKALALNSLSQFHFSYFQEQLAIFVKDVVLMYLDDPQPSIRKAAAKTGCLLYVQSQDSSNHQNISRQLMYQILVKFLGKAIADPNDQVRETMLDSLNKNFDPFLSTPNNLRTLFLCVNDPKDRVQELSLKILCRLSKHNSADIVPFLKKQLGVYLQALNDNQFQKDKEKNIIVKLITVMIKHGKEIILPHSESICQIILKHLKESNESNPNLMKALSELAKKSQQRMIPYLDQIIPVLLDQVLDKSFTKKRKSAVKTITAIIQATGCVGIPYYKYSNLLETLMEILKQETYQEIRVQILRLIGCLGAIDALSFKKNKAKLKDIFDSKQNKNIYKFDELVNTNPSLKEYKFFAKHQTTVTGFSQELKLRQELFDYYNDMIILGNFHDQQEIFLHLTETKNKNLKQQNIDEQKQVMPKRDKNKQKKKLKQILTNNRQINLQDPDYYYATIIQTLLQVLMDHSLQNHHELTIETLKNILSILRGRCSHFLDLLVPVFTYVIQQWETSEHFEKCDNLLRLLEKVLKQCEKGFKQEYIDPVVEVILKYIMEQRLTCICLDILQTLISIKKNSLHYKIEPIVKIFNKIINGYSGEQKQSKDLIIKTIGILKCLEELLDPYLDSVIKCLCRLVCREQNIDLKPSDIDLYKEVLLVFNHVAIKCPSTVQYLSLLVSNLLDLLERISLLIQHPQNSADFQENTQQATLLLYQSLQNMILNCFVVFVHQFRADFLVFLPRINQMFNKFNIFHLEFPNCIETLLNCGNLEDLSEPVHYQHIFCEHSNDNYYHCPPDNNNTNNSNNNNNNTAVYQIIDCDYNPPLKVSVNDQVINEFDTSQKTLKEDWEEWIRKSSVELLKSSPNDVLSTCSTLAEVYAHIWHELYNQAFASCWEVFNDRQKENIIKQIENAIKSPSIPQSNLQTLLSLAEFMQHDQEGLQIDNSTLGDLAEKCMAYAQALYFREQEFETPTEKTVESLIILYNHLGQPEAASGLLLYAKRNFNIDLKMSQNERWQDALQDYNTNNIQKKNNNNSIIPNNSHIDINNNNNIENNNINMDNNIQQTEIYNNPSDINNDYIVHQLRVLNQHSQYESVLEKCDLYYRPESILDKDKKSQISLLGANAALNLSEWDKLEGLIESNQENLVEYNFYKAILSIKNKDYQQAQLQVVKSFHALEGNMGGLLLESYSKRYDLIIKLQQLFEMEEIIEYKQFEQQVLDTDNQIDQQLLQKELNQRREMLKDIWFDRLQGCQKKVYVWQGILSIRELLLSKRENIDNWLKFSRIAIKKRQTSLAKRNIQKLKREINQKEKWPIELQLADYECDYYMGQLNQQQIMQEVGGYLDLQDKTIVENSKIISKGYLHLSKWLNEAEEGSEEDKKKVKEFRFKSIKESISIRENNYKGWHSYAVINYQEIEFQNRHSRNNERQKGFIIEATRGFVKAISLQGRNMFQDTLRLLNLVFNYGDWDQVRDIFQEGWKNIDILVWIEVVPQIIARIDINNEKIYELLKNLLIHLNSNYPQALIYQLVVAIRSKKEKSSQAANELLNQMRVKNKKLVDLALVVCEELIRTAMLLSELWREGIQEAWLHYSQEKNPGYAYKILKGLNEKTTNSPQSLSETAFQQQYGSDLRTAYAWLEQYDSTKDEVALNHAFDIYYQLYTRISEKLDNLKMIHLENVSPKLLSIQDTVLALPGLYKPNQPEITIAGFCPQLPVQNSKQKPRRILIYGSDGKEHHYLLKGHEDLRQDERVMQLFSLINRLLNNNQESEEKDLFLQRYAVIPLSNDTGLIEWVHNCDTLQQLIKDYRDSQNIKHNVESNLISQMIQDPSKKYPLLPVLNKLEIFRHIMENTKGEDLQKVMWLKSPNSTVWLERRTNYTRSLATMSMVGYILGLGDRHPSNIMLQRNTGRVVHIDFGDCWEVAMKREKFPEKVPFRLTRMLIKAMEACGIEGNFRSTCELVMKVLRDNRESLMAVLEAFLYDPLLNWRLLSFSPNKEKAKKKTNKNQHKTNNNQPEQDKQNAYGSLMPLDIDNNQIIQDKEDLKKHESPKRRESTRDLEMMRELVENSSSNNDNLQQINEKALAVINRCKNKLVGKEFVENKALNVLEQVNKLINQATSHENICQSYIGWQPFW